MQQYSVYTDPYHNVPRLDLYQFDGSPLQPLYQIYDPPQMLPTTTLNPMTTASATPTSKAKRTAAPRVVKRGMNGGREVPLNWKAKLQSGEVVQRINADRLWWVGLAMTGIGGMLYLGPRRMGIQLS